MQPTLNLKRNRSSHWSINKLITANDRIGDTCCRIETITGHQFSEMSCSPLHTTGMLTVCYINRQPARGYHYSKTNACGERAASKNFELINFCLSLQREPTNGPLESDSLKHCYYLLFCSGIFFSFFQYFPPVVSEAPPVKE